MTTNLSRLPQAPNVPQQTIPQMSNINQPSAQNVIISVLGCGYSTADWTNADSRG